MPVGNKTPLFGAKKIIPVGDSVIVILEATLPNPYVAGGIAITPAELGLRQLDFLLPVCSSNGWTLCWDQVNQKILAFGQPGVAGAGAHAEAGAVDLTATKIYLLAIGKR